MSPSHGAFWMGCLLICLTSISYAGSNNLQDLERVVGESRKEMPEHYLQPAAVGDEGQDKVAVTVEKMKTAKHEKERYAIVRELASIARKKGSSDAAEAAQYTLTRLPLDYAYMARSVVQNLGKATTLQETVALSRILSVAVAENLAKLNEFKSTDTPSATVAALHNKIANQAGAKAVVLGQPPNDESLYYYGHFSEIKGLKGPYSAVLEKTNKFYIARTQGTDLYVTPIDKKRMAKAPPEAPAEYDCRLLHLRLKPLMSKTDVTILDVIKPGVDPELELDLRYVKVNLEKLSDPYRLEMGKGSDMRFRLVEGIRGGLLIALPERPTMLPTNPSPWDVIAPPGKDVRFYVNAGKGAKGVYTTQVDQGAP